ncbi:MAG: hypothetical protein IH991_25700, partial [Planctomycetes bacterium]|nr:hypothetical protein [Planctomycetota bacterium]
MTSNKTTLLKSRTLWFVLAACAFVAAVPLGLHLLTDHRQSQSEVAVADATVTDNVIVAHNNAFQATGLDDPDLANSVIDEVVSSNNVIGDITNRVTRDGIRLVDAMGSLEFAGDLTIFNQNGTGLLVNSKRANTDFNLD